jgi:hypothetical protein
MRETAPGFFHARDPPPRAAWMHSQERTGWHLKKVEAQIRPAAGLMQQGHHSRQTMFQGEAGAIICMTMRPRIARRLFFFLLLTS